MPADTPESELSKALRLILSPDFAAHETAARETQGALPSTGETLRAMLAAGDPDLVALVRVAQLADTCAEHLSWAPVGSSHVKVLRAEWEELANALETLPPGARALIGEPQFPEKYR